MSVPRRSMLAAPALLAGTALFADRALAQGTPTAGNAQAPGFYRFALGDYTVTVINDGLFRRDNPAEGFVRNASRDQVRGVLAENFLPTQHLNIVFNFTVLQTGRETILFDTGTGGLLAPTAGLMWANLQAAGIDPAQVDRIIFTHFHGDHVSGLVTREGQARLPKAELVVPAPEWAFWTSERAPEQGRTMVAGRFRPYEGRVRQVPPNADLGSGITGIPTHGHTPGHTSYGIQNGNATVMVLGDVTNHPLMNLVNPDWQVVFDMDGAAAAATRRALFDRAASDRTPIIGYHWPFPAVARVRASGNGFALAPIDWNVGL